MFDQRDLGFLRQRDDEAATRGFFGGLLPGILVGIVITLIFAPRRGDETRAAVTAAAGDLKAKASDLVGCSERNDDGGDQPGTAIERKVSVPARDS